MKRCIPLGTQFKAVVKLEPIAGMSMDDYEFYAEFFCFPNNKLKVEKKQMIRKGENEYWAAINSAEVGVGLMQCGVYRVIPDADFPDGERFDGNLLKLEDEIHIVKL